MVAFELALLHEKAGQSDECIRWYSLAAERFRRAEWKKKAEEALTRLGAPIPASPTAASPASVERDPLELEEPESAEVFTIEPSVKQAPEESANDPDDNRGNILTEAPALAPSQSGQTPGGERSRRRRGRRGGRGRRKSNVTEMTARASQPVVAEKALPPATPKAMEPPAPVTPPTSLDRRSESREHERILQYHTRAEQEGAGASERALARGRAGEPALASRLAHLESTLRRLLSSPLHRLEEADDAPAGPGVFLLSESDLTATYYVESCQTLRVALGHLVRGGRNQRGGSNESLRSRLAEHLGINESKISDYLRKHCVVRWIQLDEEAPYFGHFVIGVLRTPLNNE